MVRGGFLLCGKMAALCGFAAPAIGPMAGLPGRALFCDALWKITGGEEALVNLRFPDYPMILLYLLKL